MPFPESSLAKGEEVRYNLRPHWRVLMLPGLWAFVALLVVIIGWNLPDGIIGHLFFLLVVAAAVSPFTLWPLLVRQATFIVFTNQRILLRHGVINVKLRDIPLIRLNEVAVHQNFIDRFFGCGALLVGGKDGSKLDNVPDVVKMAALVNELIPGTGHQRGAGLADVEKVVKDLYNLLTVASGQSQSPPPAGSTVPPPAPAQPQVPPQPQPPAQHQA
jgi:membrane protein YdbS with pleckstrin-like domain